MHPDLTKLVSLSVKPLETAADAVTGGETLTVDTTAGDTTGVQDPTTEGGTVETVQTEEPTVEVQDPATEGGTVETVKTEKPKLERQEGQPSRRSQGRPGPPRDDDHGRLVCGTGVGPGPRPSRSSSVGSASIRRTRAPVPVPPQRTSGGGETGGGDAG